MFGVKEGTLTVPGGQMDYICFGRGTKPLVMIQGLNARGIRGSGTGLAWMYRCFAGDWKVWVFDRKTELPEGVTVKDLAEDYAAAMDAAQIRGAHILGVSQGGMIAQHLAAERPELVEKLALAVTAFKTNAPIADSIETWITQTRAEDWKALTEDMTRRMYSEAYFKRYQPMLPLLVLVQKPRDPERFINLARACLTCDTEPVLDRIRCPVLVLGGGRDLVVGGDTARELAGKLNCRLHLYEDLGHAAYHEAPDFNSRVLRFFRE